MKKTNCQKCLFAHPAGSENPCEHGIIQHLQLSESKDIEIVDNFYVIKDYVCKMGFSKEIYDNNTSYCDINQLKTHITNNMIKIYLVLDITNTNINNIKQICEDINKTSIIPKFISFLCFDKENLNTDMIDHIRKSLSKEILWKIHVFVDKDEYSNLVHSVLSSNKKANDSQLILFYQWQNIKELDRDINEINTICNIEQQDFHMMVKNNCQLNNQDYSGILISFDNYMTCRRVNENIIEAINDNQDIIIYRYG
jgi:hypothetical protein